MVSVLRFFLIAVLSFWLASCTLSAPYDSGSADKKTIHNQETKTQSGKPVPPPDIYYDQMWLGALSSVAFMDIKVADKYSGVITTGWYESKAHKGERFALNVLVLKGKKPSQYSYRVKVRKQIRQDGRWVDDFFDPRMNYEIAQKMYNKSKKLKDNLKN